MFQRVQIIGNLGKDPEMRFTQAGVPVTSFSVATNETWQQDGEQQERVTWWKVTAWQRMAETANQYLKKGSQVLIEGQIVVDENGGPKIWTDRDGNPRASLEINARTIKFLGGRGESSGPRDEEVPPEADAW